MNEKWYLPISQPMTFLFFYWIFLCWKKLIKSGDLLCNFLMFREKLYWRYLNGKFFVLVFYILSYIGWECWSIYFCIRWITQSDQKLSISVTQGSLAYMELLMIHIVASSADLEYQTICNSHLRLLDQHFKLIEGISYAKY